MKSIKTGHGIERFSCVFEKMEVVSYVLLIGVGEATVERQKDVSQVLMPFRFLEDEGGSVDVTIISEGNLPISEHVIEFSEMFWLGIELIKFIDEGILVDGKVQDIIRWIGRTKTLKDRTIARENIGEIGTSLVLMVIEGVAEIEQSAEVIDTIIVFGSV